MPICRLLRNEVLEPEEISVLIAVYEQILVDPRVQDPSEAVAETIAKKVIVIARTGERDKARVVERVISEL
jgi:hypothetical protein